jgi:excisionase family DNA binding protein
MQQSMNLEQAGEFLGISPHTLRAWARGGRVPHFKLGRRLVFDRADLEEFLTGNRVDSTKKPAHAVPRKIGRHDPERRR